MKRIYLRQFIKTLILFLIISIVMLLVQEYDSFYARFTASTMKEAVLYESLKDFYVNACPLEFVESFGLGFWQILIPLISIYSVFPFITYKDKIMAFIMYKKDNYKKEFYLKVVIYSIIGALAIYIGYIIVFEGLAAIFPPRGPRGDLISHYSMFSDIFKRQTLIEHYHLYYIAEGFFKYFLISFEFGLLTIFVSLKTDKKYLVVIIPFMIYVVSALTGSGDLSYISVLTTTAPSTYQYLITTYLVGYHFFFILLLLVLIKKYLKKNQERIE